MEKRRRTWPERVQDDLGRNLIMSLTQKHPETISMLVAHLQKQGYDVTAGFGDNSGQESASESPDAFAFRNNSTGPAWIPCKYDRVRDLPCDTLVTNILLKIGSHSLQRRVLAKQSKDATRQAQASWV